jgi:hypothetical protein
MCLYAIVRDACMACWWVRNKTTTTQWLHMTTRTTTTKHYRYTCFGSLVRLAAVASFCECRLCIEICIRFKSVQQYLRELIYGLDDETNAETRGGKWHQWRPVAATVVVTTTTVSAAKETSSSSYVSNNESS